MKDSMKMRYEQGFTIVELLVVILIMGVVMAGVYSVYSSQQKSFLIQEDVAEMQQNLRSAMLFMVKEIRLAGCNPTGKLGTGAGILTANANNITIAMDIRGNNLADPPDGDVSDPNETVTYSLIDSDGDGTNDALGRKEPGDPQPLAVASNIDAINFVYLDQNSGNLGYPPDLTKIRILQITVVARTGDASAGYVDHRIYNNLQGTPILPAQNDSFRRRLFSTNIFCRNLGLL